MTFNFNAPYNRENWIKFLRQQFLPQDYSTALEKTETEFSPKYISKNVLYLGNSQTLKLKVYEMYHNSENDPRIGLSRDAFKFIEHQKVKNALIFFISKNSGNYRFSLITRELKLEGKKVTKEFTNPKRYSYFIGPEVKKHTIEQFLVKKGRVKDEEDLKSRFSVEIVNKEFYNNIAELFTELVGGVRKIGRQTKEFEPLLKLPDTTDHTLMQEFAVRLIGRIVFCWFLKKKKSKNGISLIPEEVLSVKAIKDNYYHTILEPLFFEVMNTPIDERKERFCHSEPFDKLRTGSVEGEQAEDVKDNINWSSIPFLNGGLFDPNLHNDYYKYSPMEKEYKPAYDLKIPDDWFVKFFSVLELYNFTIDENTSVDIDLSVDPEMLGRIFENLLAEINPETLATARKATGSYYTPRPIVEYMVDESLIQYLLTKLNSPPLEGGIKGGLSSETQSKQSLSFNSAQDESPSVEKSPLERGTALAVGCVTSLEQKIRNLLDYTIEENELNKEESLKVIDALDKIKILDPACGSGAFPMGILQKMLLIRQKVDPESIEWVMKQLEMIPDILVRKAFEEKLMDENWDYKYKMSAILHSIYGVDIQTIAVELSKLRFFLTLMVDETVNDEKPNRGINELPNLSFKFVAANTLIGLPEAEENQQMDLMDFDNLLDPMMQKLEELREKFFYASGKEKERIEKEFKHTQIEIGQFLGKEGSTNKRAVALANWDPFADKSSDWFDPKWMFGIEDGFDIVIGNPPYFQIQKFSGQQIQKDYKAQKFESFAKTGDIYGLFYEKGNLLLKEKGILTFITSNKWMRANYGKKLRKYFSKETQPIKLIDFGGYKVFESATVDTNILIIKKCTSQLPKYSKLWKFDCIACTIRKGFTRETDITEYLKENAIELSNLTEESWIISTKEEFKIKQKIEQIGTPLRDWDISIYRGVLTGFNEAFIISRVKKDELITQDPKSSEIIKPILRGRDIKRYKAEFADLWLIASHNGYKDKNGNKIPRIDIENYPAIKDHLDKYWDKISKRYDKGDTPYNLRNCAYYKEFEKEKIVWAETIKIYFHGQRNFPRFSINSDNFLDKTCFMLIYDNNKYLLSILNSKVSKYLIMSLVMTLGKGSLGLQKLYIEHLPIPKISEDLQQPFIKIVDQILIDKRAGKDTQLLEDKIDLMVYKLYELSYEEVKVVDSALALTKEEYEQDLS